MVAAAVVPEEKKQNIEKRKSILVFRTDGA